MKDRYPSETTCPLSSLVPEAAQPDYFPADGVNADANCNVGDHLADRQVRKGNGDRIAAIHAESGRRYSFSDLARQSSEVAGGLIAAGLRVGDRVAYCAPNHPDVLIVMLAIWKAGGIVVPVPAHARNTELDGYLEDTAVRYFFIHRSLANFSEIAAVAAQASVERVFDFGWDAGISDQFSIGSMLGGPYAAPRAGGDHLAIIWHTGGTTGKPKGCYHTHRRFLHGGYAFGKATGVAAGQRWSAAAPIGHALGIIYNTIFTMLHGATAVFVEKFSEADHLINAIETHKITTLTALMGSWAKMVTICDSRPDVDLSSLRRCFAMWQSASSSNVFDYWKRRGVELLNNFGSTSFATWVLIPALGEASPQAALGRPIPGYEVEAISLEGGRVQPVPRGVIGQMAVRGPTGLTYWNLPHMQKKDVVDGWTLSDDLIEFDAAGIAHYRGRSDSMISTSGFKVAPVEVENILSRHSSVAEVAVVPAPCPIRQQMVVAYVALHPGEEGSDALKEELVNLVKRDLSSYKAPRRIEFVDMLPRDAVGKIRTKILKDWAETGVISKPTT